MRVDGEKSLAKTKVSKNNSTSIPKPVRTREGIESDDTVGWYFKDGEWRIRKVSSDADGEGK